MRPKKHVLVLMGGMSAEYEVSLKSGEQVISHLDENVYKVTPVEITRSGEWIFPEAETEYMDISEAIPHLRELHPDCVFIALHGPFGEDGRVQGMLDLLGIPYTGSGCAASALAIDKIRSKMIVEEAGIRVPDDMVFTQREWQRDADAIVAAVEKKIGFPCVAKNPVQGSSLGMAIPQDSEEFRYSIEDIFGFGYTIMVEKYIEGREFTCGILDLDESTGAVALPVTEIRAGKSKFFDYHAKYTPNAAEEITPAEISDSLRDRIQEMAICAHKTIGCRGFSRSDMIVSGEDIYWLEVNTIPGLTETSLLPQAAEAAGISFSDLLGKLVEAALI